MLKVNIISLSSYCYLYYYYWALDNYHQILNCLQIKCVQLQLFIATMVIVAEDELYSFSFKFCS